MDRLELKIPPPLLFLLLAGLMWLLSRATPDMRGIEAGFYPVAALALSGSLLLLAGVAAFIRARTSVDPRKPDGASALVSSGIYRLSRNPMYLGDLLLLGAWAFYLGNALTLILLPVFVLYMNRFQIRPEERALGRHFGAAYHDYCRRVRRWL
ncbi:isoprenylcysteine carboxylmethyltransferase family protein [Aquitalea sp. S1-19]|nr:isoprenylcysteine carboxylmethyltransferase family protein [Aquitalea sp. S1-19]